MAEYTFISDLGKAMWEEKQRKDQLESLKSKSSSDPWGESKKAAEANQEWSKASRDRTWTQIYNRIPTGFVGMAKGGAIQKNQQAIVAEEGPEFYVDKAGKTKFLDEEQQFAPKRSGTIVPNDEVRKLVRAYLNGEK